MAIEHIVIIVKENHSFDNYFGTLPGADGQHLERAPNPPPFDPPHDHLTWMHRAGTSRFHMQYTSDDISDYFSYAKNYTVCDRYFSEVAGPSTPKSPDANLRRRAGHQQPATSIQPPTRPGIQSPIIASTAGTRRDSSGVIMGVMHSIISMSLLVTAVITPAIYLCMTHYPAGYPPFPGSTVMAGLISANILRKISLTACVGQSSKSMRL